MWVFADMKMISETVVAHRVDVFADIEMMSEAVAACHVNVFADQKSWLLCDTILSSTLSACG